MRRRPMTFVSARSWMRADRGSVFTFCHGTSLGTEARYAMWSNPGSPEKRPVASSMETAARPQT
eukprot:859656-Rhodomonas_salina.1